MAKGKISSIIDFSPIEQEEQRLVKILDDIESKIGSLSQIQIKVSSAGNFKELSNATREYSSYVKQTENFVKQLQDSEAKLVIMRQKQALQLTENKLRLKELNKEQTERLRIQNAEKGSIEELSLKYDKAYRIYKQLSEAQRNTVRGQSLQKFLAETDAQLKLLEGSVGNNRRKVGSYNEAATLIVDALEKEKKKLEELEATKIKIQNAGQTFQPGTGLAARTTVTGFAGGGATGGLSGTVNQDIQSLEQLDQQILKSRSIVEGFQRALENKAVINATDELSRPFERLATKLGELKNNLGNGIGIDGTDAAALQRAADAIAIIERTLERSQAAGTNSTKQVKDLTNAYTGLSRVLGENPGGKEFLSDLSREIGQAKDSVQDLKDELKLQASDTKGIDNVVGSLNALAGIAQGAAGAYALLGAEEEDAAKITAKLVAIQGIANSVQQVGQELTRKGTIANKIYEASLNTMSTAFGTGSTAAQRFNAILKVGVVGLVVTGLVLLIAKLKEYREANDAASKSAEDLKQIQEQGLKNAAEEVTKVRLLYEATQNQTLSLKERKKAVDELQQQYPGYFKNLTDEEILTGKAADSYNKLTESIIKTGLAQAAKARITEISSQMLDDFIKVEQANEKIKRIQKEGVAVQDQIIPKTLASGNTVNIAPFRFSTDEKDKQKAIDSIKRLYADSFKVVEEGQSRIDAIVKAIGAGNLIDTIIGKKENVEKSKKLADNTAAEILKAQYEFQRLLIEQSAEASRKIFEDETQTYEDRISALRNFTAQQMALVELEQQFEADQESLRLKSIKEGLEAQKKEKGANIKAINEQIAREEEASNERIRVIALKGSIQLQKVGEDLNKNLKKLADDRANIRKEEEQQLQEYEEFTIGWLKDFRKKQADENAKWDAEDERKREETRRKLKDAQKQLYQEAFNTLVFFLTSSIDKENQAIETKKRLLDEDTQRRINQINLLGMAESDRVKAIAKVEKQAAYDKEQLEKRQRKLAVERAKFEKLANIASIISSTAQAVIGALGQKPWSPANIALAAVVGGIGALQLARAIAAPIPQYRVGTKNAKKGPAIVSEEGQELMSRNGQLFLTPHEPTLLDLAGGEQIVPADITRDILATLSFSKMLQRDGLTRLQPNGMSHDQADTLIGEIRDLKSITSRSRIAIYNESGIESSAYYLDNIKYSPRRP